MITKGKGVDKWLGGFKVGQFVVDIFYGYFNKAKWTTALQESQWLKHKAQTLHTGNLFGFQILSLELQVHAPVPKCWQSFTTKNLT